MLAAIAAERCSKDRAFPNTLSSLPPSKLGSIYITSYGGGRGVCSKEITSRHLSSSLMSSSKSNSSCISTISSSSSSLSSSSSTPRRFSSPLHDSPPNPSALPQRRSQSVDRSRLSPEGACPDKGSVAPARAVLRTTARSLPVSFQGESFVFQISKAKPTTEFRKSIAACPGVENSLPNNKQKHRYLTARARELNLISRSLDCSRDSGNPLLKAVRLLLDEANSNVSDQSQSLDSNSFSSASILSLSGQGTPVKLRAKPRGICVPARFRQENGCPRSQFETPQRLVTGKQQQLTNTQLPSPRIVPSPQYEPRSISERKEGVSRTRRNIMASYSSGQVGNAPSIISFATEVRRTKKGESRIEDAHMLRLFHNRYLQWRYINSRAENSFLTQLMSAKNNLHNAWISISELQNSAMIKQIQLQVLTQNLKLASILKKHIVYLDEWCTVDQDHKISVRGAIEALEASTLRLPVIEGAKVDIQEVEDAVSSSIDVLQAMEVLACSSLSKVAVISSLTSELFKVAAFELSFLNQSRDLLSMVAALHVKQCSLQGYILQLGRKSNMMQLL